MVNENVDEYKLIKEELQGVKVTMTTYLMITMGGAGLAYFGFRSVLEVSDFITLLTVSNLTAGLIAGFFYLSLYQFNSHNRYAGYARLLGQERALIPIQPKKGVPRQLMAWEPCVALLLNARQVREFPLSRWKQMRHTGILVMMAMENFERYRLCDPVADRSSGFKGLWLILTGGRIERQRPTSWRFPLYSCYLYYLLIFFFLTAAFSSALRIDADTIALLGNSWWPMVLANILILGATLVVILRSFGKVYRLMKGSQTVDAYCWKLLIPRIEYLNRFNLSPDYHPVEKPPYSVQVGAQEVADLQRRRKAASERRVWTSRAGRKSTPVPPPPVATQPAASATP